MFVVLARCSSESSSPQQVTPEPQVRATVLTIRTTIHPSNKTFLHWLVVAADRARLGNEVDQWRLFDFQKQTVTFVDDLQKTYRTEPIAAVMESYRRMANAELPDGFPRAQYAITGRTRTINGVNAAQSIISMGGYQRELWIASTKEVPPELFSMVVASEPLRSGLSGMMREVAAPLLSVRGFPILDRAQLTYGGAHMDITREVVRVEEKDVPASWINVDSDYRQLVHRASAPSVNPPAEPPRREALNPAPVSTPTTTVPTAMVPPPLPTATLPTESQPPAPPASATGTAASTSQPPSSTAPPATAPIVTSPSAVVTPEATTQGPPKPPGKPAAKKTQAKTSSAKKKTPLKKGTAKSPSAKSVKPKTSASKASASKASASKATARKSTIAKKPATSKKPAASNKTPPKKKKTVTKSKTAPKTAT